MASPADLAALARAREQVRQLESRRRAVEAQLRTAVARRARLVAGGAAPERIAEADARVDALTEALADAHQGVAEAQARVRELLDRIAEQDAPEAAVATLDGQVPVALLPVRVETRFADGGATLHVRLFPDQLHVDAHEPELTADEVAAGRAYWERRWPAPADMDEARGAWLTLATGRRPTRARWVAEATRPTNPLGAGPAPEHREVALRATTWTRPPRAVTLPTRWVAIGRRGGQEMFRVWSGPVADSLEVGPSPDDEAPSAEGSAIGDGLRWLTEPRLAEEAGVMLTVRDPSLRDGLDDLVVLGVDSTQTPEQAAADLARLLAGHAYTDGLAFLPQGTPTNNTADVPSGHTSDRDAALDALDPALDEPADPAWSAGPRLEAALGTAGAGGAGAGGSLAGVPGAATAEHAVASALVDATWEATGGMYLGHLLAPVGRIRPLISDRDIDQLRLWAAAHLFASGPLPVLRAGRQPYGVLPVVDPRRYAPPAGDRAAELVAATTARLRRWWERGAGAVPRLDRTNDLDATLVALLQRSPVSAAVRFRRIFPPWVLANVARLGELAEQQQLHAWVVESILDGRPSSRRLRIDTLTTDPRSHPMRIPWARPAGLAAGAPLPYIGPLLDVLRSAGGRDTLVGGVAATSLAQALLVFAAALELDAAHARVVRKFAEDRGVASPLVDALRIRPDAIGIGVEPPADPGPLAFGSPKVLADAVLPDLTGSRTVAEHVRDQVRVGTAPAVHGLRRLMAALERLRGEPGERVDWALRGVLDLYSYRLDAWCTGLATQRLADLRRARPAGVHVGCYGWVEDLRPDPADRESLGYVHTPSVNHAIAAAVLRSGHVAHRGAAQEALAVDLSAGRVRTAMAILDGVEAGQPLGALLGYRIERLLRERDAVLARYVLPLRRLAPLRHTDEALDGPVEAIAARDVVDGVRLLEQWRDPATRGGVLLAAGVLAQHRDAVTAVLEAADDVLDAVGDVLLSETVYQTVAGNHERAAAALAALDRQQRPVRPEVVQTPRTGTTVAHRVLVLLGDDDAPGWEQLRDPRSAAEPRLNGWAARLLGPPAGLAFAAEVRRGDTVRAEVSVTAAELGLSPLSLVLAAQRAASDQPSELEARLARALAEKVPDGTEDDRLVLLPGSESWGLHAVRTVAGWLDRLASGRAADGHALEALLHDAPAGHDIGELRNRANAAGAALAAAASALAGGERSGLDLAAALGVPDALPGADPDAQVSRVLATVQAKREELAALEAAFAGTAEPTPQQRVDHHVARLRVVLGQAFPVLPRFEVAGAGGLAASLADRAALLGGDDLAPLTWLHRVGLVRPAVEPLSALLTAAEATGRDVGLPRLDVAQLPHEPGGRWVALPVPAGGEVPGGAVGIVVHAPSGLDPAGALAGLVVDEWTEVIPSARETTALSFHYDAPAAQPPQVVLLAVPGAPDSQRWSFDELLGTVREAIALTRIRAVGPADLPDLGGFLPALYVSQDVTGDVPTIDLFDLADRAQLAGVQPDVLGKG